MHASTTFLADRDILATTAHELRNALSPLSDAVDLLESAADPERRAWAMRVARRQLDCMRQLVSDMSDAGVCADRSAPLACERIVLQQLVEECVAACGPMFAARDQHASSTLASDPLWIDADAVRLTQVVANLLTNASKYTQRGGHISIGCAKANAMTAEIAVADDGAGISPNNLSRIFEPFYREAHAKRIAPGLGVGLSVVGALVQAHGGAVWAESSGPGTGSRFVVRLPLPTAGTPPT